MKSNNVYHDSTTYDAVLEGYGPIHSIQDLTTGWEVDTQKVYGTGNEAIGRTPGILNATDGTLTILKWEYDNMVRKFGGVKGLSHRTFDIVKTAQIFGEPPSVTVYQDCRIIGAEESITFGDSSAVTVSLTLQIMAIKEGAFDWIGVQVPFLPF